MFCGSVSGHAAVKHLLITVPQSLAHSQQEAEDEECPPYEERVCVCVCTCVCGKCKRQWGIYVKWLDNYFGVIFT